MNGDGALVGPSIGCGSEAKCRDCDRGDAEMFENHKLFLQCCLAPDAVRKEKELPEAFTLPTGSLF
jgi:hypothetical protein